MSDRHRYPPDDHDFAEPSREAVTPRGGFMARPGLKEPPRHAVVVRVGDAPATGEIPLARQSKPPPELVLPPPPSGQDDKVTLRAIPTPRAPRVAEPPPVIESVPPPSDMPVVASVRPPDSGRGNAPRRSGSTIALAAAAGIVLGLGSVAMSRWAAPTEPPPAAAGPSEPSLQPVVSVTLSPLASSAPAPSQSAAPLTSATPPVGAPPRPARRAIF